MNAFALQPLTAAALVVLGLLFALHERRTRHRIAASAFERRAAAVVRRRRRLRIAVLLVFLGLLLGCGHWTAAERNPFRFLAIWGAALLFSLALLWYGVIDLLATRKQLRAEFRARESALRAVRERPCGSPASPSDRAD